MKLSRINTAILVLIVAINSYVLLMPFVPGLLFTWQKKHTNTAQRLQNEVRAAPSTNVKIPQENRLIVPSMLLDQQIFEGKTMRTLRQGLWRRPATSTPDKGGNTVIVGHRFTYTNPRGTFYYLDKVKVGDQIAVWWAGKKHRYQVSQVLVVKPDATYIEAPTDKPQLTLYTCTPLWLPKNRLIVIALEENS